ncbi:MAG: methyl-accepting chemotaxis protein [Desulforegulaceae bacterium]|nr:methyl-accepting chemotaxis protein [Desulforegulaceae bacterium]
MGKKRSLKFKFMAYVGSVVFLGFFITIVIVANKANKTAYDKSMAAAWETGYRYSNEIKDMMTQPLDTSKALASVMSGLKESKDTISRETANEIFKSVLEKTPEIMGVWSVWEPNAFDGKDSEYKNTKGHDSTGRFIPYWNRVGGIHLEPCVEYELEDGYYKRPLKTGESVFTEPYTYKIGGQNVMVVSVCSPVKVGGRVVGVVGTDYSMDTFWDLAKKIKPFGTGYIMVVASNGDLAAHPQEKIIGTNVNDYFPNDRIAEKMIDGESFYLKKSSTIDNLTSYYLVTPVSFGENIINWGFVTVFSENEIFKDARNIRNTAIIIGIVSLLVILGILYWIGDRVVARPVLSVMKGIREVAEGEGDLTKRLEIKNTDEIGELAFWFNKFIDNLQSMIKVVSENVSAMDDSSQNLLKISKNVTAETENTRSRAELVATASEELSSNMNSIAGAMEQTSTNIGGVASAMEQMSATVNEIAGNSEKTKTIAENAVVKSEATSKRMDNLGEAAKQIGEVVDAITDISDQTNLLALNATIEAARAGEAGKGFAVVANEIKELATQTVGATNDIKEKISLIQNATKTSVADMAEIKDIIVEINDFINTIATAVEEQSVSSDEISNNVNQAAQGVQEVNENVTQSSQVSSEIAKDISEVNRAVGVIDELGKDINERSNQLSKASEKLNNLVRGFKID